MLPGASMRKIVALAAMSLLAITCAPQEYHADTPSSYRTAANCIVSNRDNLYTTGGYAIRYLTVATGNPAFPPWWEGGTTEEHPEWKVNDPYLGRGFEGAVAFGVAERLGFSADKVRFVPIGFRASFAPGDKDFDFAIGQISYTPQRAKAVDFSDGYYDVNQALIADNGSPAIGVTTLAGLKDLKLGAPVGTTSLQVIQDEVQPNVEPGVYPDLDTALKDLHIRQLDGVVVDFPDAFYGYADQIVGQFPQLSGGQEQFGLAFEKGNPLVSCVSQAIATLDSNGTLKQLDNEWLETDASVPVFS